MLNFKEAQEGAIKLILSKCKHIHVASSATLLLS